MRAPLHWGQCGGFRFQLYDLELNTCVTLLSTVKKLLCSVSGGSWECQRNDKTYCTYKDSHCCLTFRTFDTHVNLFAPDRHALTAFHTFFGAWRMAAILAT